jgi:glycosyltransferase involved in cell wall biosynthesis|tara:strand:- start:7665 stop:8495 length:831 start_codon:yes stop_codon:yes gene_type:complete
MISIILSTYNNEQTISYSIKSILNQSYEDFELIIVNDCSKDNTKKVIKSFEDRRIVYLENNSNIGRSQSRNKAIKHANGNFIAVMDGDDISVPERLEIQLKYLINNPNIDLVASNTIFFTDNKVTGVSDVQTNTPKDINFFLRPIGLPHVTWMVRKNFFVNYKYNPNISMAIDQDLLLRSFNSVNYFLLKQPLVFVNEPKKKKIRYKLNQLYVLFMARLKFIKNHKLFYHFPIIVFIFIISCIFYIFGFRTNKTIKTSNYHYQNLLDKIKAKRLKI